MRVKRRMMHGMNKTQQSAAIPDWTLGWRLRRALEFANVKAGDMADELGVARSTITRWMHGDGASPRPIYVRQWAVRCGVPYEWLKDGDSPSLTGEYLTESLGRSLMFADAA